jgi:hypothetical protein
VFAVSRRAVLANTGVESTGVEKVFSGTLS